MLDLPTDRPRPRVAGHAGARVELRLDADLTGRVRALGLGQGSTLFTTLLAAFQALLGRLTGQDDLLVGSPATLRRDRAFDGVVGYFVNPVVMRADLAGSPSFAAHLAHTRQAVALALEGRDLPFHRLAGLLQPVRDPGRPPVVQALFTYQSAAPGQAAGLAAFAVGKAGARVDLDGLVLESFPLDPGTVQVDLELSAAEVGDALVLACRHDAGLFDRVTIERWLGALRTLLDAAAARPEERVGELELLTAAERSELLAQGEGPRPLRAGSGLIHDLVSEQARHAPEAVALTLTLTTGDESTQITYAELVRRSRALARTLRGLGVAPEVPVGLFLERSPEMVVALLGVLTAGGFYVPLDPSLPDERLAHMVEDCRPAVVITGGSTPWRLGGGLQEIRFSAGWDIGADPDPELYFDLDPDLDPGNLAYTIYTSGSTGKPKGVQLSHRAVVNFLCAMAERPGLESGDVVPALTTLSFDIAGLEIYLPLSRGGRIEIVSRDEAADGRRLARRIAEAGVTVMQATPATWRLLVDSGWPGQPGLKALCGGEALPRELAGELLARGVELWNVYGPTETAIWSTAGRVAPGPDPVRLGQAIDHTRLFVVDRGGELAPPGVPGELWIAGDGVARGYLGRPDLTAERFVADPFSEISGARLYRTGDLVRRRRRNLESDLEFLGRIDQQVKLRGFRIEPGEIEAALDRHPGVAQSVVVVQDRAGDRRLIAHWIPRPDRSAPAPGEMREFLRASLPEHMVPPAFVLHAALPLTPGGKVDRKALLAAEWRGAGDDHVAPRTPVEEVLAGIWAEVLGVERVGATDHFFDLGGHSLVATRVTSRLRQTFKVEFPLRDLFEAPVLADLAARVEAALRAGASRPAPPLVPVERDGPLPLSFAQQRLWLIDRLEPGSPLYNLSGALRAEGPLDRAALARCLGEIVRRHEALRTTFAERDGAPVQVIHPAEPFALPMVDLAGLPGPVPRLMADEAARPFDLTRGPLLRAVLLRLAEEDHALVLTQHHIVSDGWSLGLLIRELTALYPAFAAGRPSPLPELPVQSADFAVWQRSWLQGEILEQAIAFWRTQLEGLPPLLVLPTDRPRPAAQSFRGAARPVRLPAGLARRLKALARREGSTLFMVLLAGFQTLLARYSGQDDLAVGAPVAGRNRVEIEGLIGFFVNTLVLRGNLSGGPSFRELLARVLETALAADLHQDVPFERLVEALAPERNLSYSPLLQVMLVLQNAHMESLELGDLRLQPMPAAVTTAKFDLALILEEHGGALAGTIEYSTDLYDAATIDRLILHYETLLTAALAAPELLASEAPLLPEAERHQILIEWGGTAGQPPAESTLHGGFEACARQAPEAPALTCEGVTLSYGELNRRANQLARWLRRNGVVPESRVGLSLERSSDLVVGLLGILKAGGAYVPLDPGTPRERLGFLSEDSGVETVVDAHFFDAHRELLETLPGGDLEPRLSRTQGANAAYVIYTSGSTGRPKGVPVTHGNVVRLFEATREGFGFGEEDVFALFHSYAFDFSVWEIWGALLHGGRLVIVPYTVSRSPELFLDLLIRERVTVLNQTPSAFAGLAQADAERGGAATDLRLVIFGGEALDAGRLAPWFVRHGDVRPRLVNMYGITETTVHVTCRPLRAADAAIEASGARRSVIGSPIPDLSLAVMTPGLQPAPIGVPGELVVGGAGLARGYLGRPELTAERFVPDPGGGYPGASPGARLYRSGDLGRFLPHGEVEYLGRIDHQVKIRGFRIELGEIEAVLAAQPRVHAAVVVAREDRSGDRRLVAYVAGDGAADVLRRSLREQLRERLPDYMMPAALVVLPALPLTPHGKVDRKALPAPQEERPAEGWQAPRTPVEEVLAGLWAGLLDRERIGANDHFFDLGGHSLLAMQLTSLLRGVFGVQMQLLDLFAAPRLTDFATRVESAMRAGTGPAAPPLVPIPPALREKPLPLSFAQQRLWFLDQLEPGSPLYNVSGALRIEGRLDPEVLARCLTEIVRRHEALRTVFAVVGDSPVQVIQPAGRFGLPVVDLAGLPARHAVARAFAQEEAGRPFDLGRGPLLRAVLLRLAAEEHVIALTVHHIVSDGWSMGLLVREVASLYEALTEGRPSPLPELPVQSADFAVWQRSWLQGEILEGTLSFWRRQLAGLPPRLELPADRPRSAMQSFRGASRPLRLPAGLTERLHALSRREGATLFMVLLSGFQTLLARYCGQDDLAVGSPVAGRGRTEIEGLIGFFVNTLVVRGDLSGRPSVRDLLGRTRATALAAYAHQDLPFDKLVEELAPERSLSHVPLVQVMLGLQNASFASLEIPGLRLRPLRGARTTAKFDLTLSFEEQGGELAGEAEYASDLFDAATIDRLCGHFERLLDGFCEEPQRLVEEIVLLTAEEARQLAGWNATARDYPAAPVHELFARQAERAPDAVAVVFGGRAGGRAGDRSLTYGELDLRSRRLARRLRRLGVGPGALVGLCAERSAEMIVGMLGILAAGGAYVPLDPDDPEERLAFLLEDLLEDRGAGVLVAQEHLTGRFPTRTGLRVEILARAEEDSDPGLPALSSHASPEDPAYVIYTSGSTGRPSST